MNQKILLRILFNIVIIVSVLTMPLYVQMLLITVGVIAFNFFWESLVFALILDTLFSIPIDMVFSFQYFYTVIFVSIFLILQWIKKIIR